MKYTGPTGRTLAAVAMRGTLALMGVGVVLSLLTGRAKELADQEGELGKSSRDVLDTMGKLAGVLRKVGDASILALGGLIRFVKGAGELAAALVVGAFAPKPQPGDFGEVDIERLQKSWDAPTARIAQLKRDESQIRSNLTAAGRNTDSVNRTMERARADTGGLIEDIMGKGGISSVMEKHALPGSARDLAQKIAHLRGIEAQQSMQDVFLPKSTDYWSKDGPDKTKIRTMREGSFQQVQGVATFVPRQTLQPTKAAWKAHQDLIRINKLFNSALGRAQKTIIDYEKVMAALLKSSVGVLASKHKGVANLNPDFNFPNATFVINQDLRGEDPDRILMIFKEDLGKVASQQIQSRLAPATP